MQPGVSIDLPSRLERRPHPAGGLPLSRLQPKPPRVFTTGQETIKLVADLLRSGHLVRLRVTGRSMSPWLEAGAIVTLQGVSAALVAPGDVVFCQTAAGNPVLHRVLRRQRAGDGTPQFLIKGDACAAPDGRIPGCRIAGKVVAVARRTSRDRMRDVRFDTGSRQFLHRLLAVGSSRSPRLFRALSRRLVPSWRRIRLRLSR